MDHTKSSIRKLIIDGKLEKAGAAALEYADFCGLEDISNGLTAAIHRAKELEKQKNSTLITHEAYSVSYAQIVNGLVDWVGRLPAQPIAAKGKRTRLLSETTFKKRVFYLLCIVKLAVVGRLAYHWSTGGFNNEQFQATITLLVPALAAYISVMLADYLRQTRHEPKPPRYLSGPLVTFSYWLFPVYALALFFFIEMKAKTAITFVQMNFWLALVESVLGGYVGQVVFAFFKKDE